MVSRILGTVILKAVLFPPRQGTCVQEPSAGPQRPVPPAGPRPAALSEALHVRPPGCQRRLAGERRPLAPGEEEASLLSPICPPFCQSLIHSLSVCKKYVLLLSR